MIHDQREEVLRQVGPDELSHRMQSAISSYPPVQQISNPVTPAEFNAALKEKGCAENAFVIAKGRRDRAAQAYDAIMHRLRFHGIVEE
jgi:trehalose utilization protein